MKGREIREIGVSSRGMHICNNADIPKLGEMRLEG